MIKRYFKEKWLDILYVILCLVWLYLFLFHKDTLRDEVTLAFVLMLVSSNFGLSYKLHLLKKKEDSNKYETD